MPYFMLDGLLQIEVAEINPSLRKIQFSYVCFEFGLLSFKFLNFIKMVIYLREFIRTENQHFSQSVLFQG